MSFYVYILFTINICLSIVLYNYLRHSVKELCELDTCPYCYGTDGCNILNNDIHLESTTISDIIFNYISVKNVYFVKINNTRVVLKKLAHSNEFKLLNQRICANNSEKNCELNKLDDKSDYGIKVLEVLNSDDQINNFKICNSRTSNSFFNDVLSLRRSDVIEKDFLKHVWTVLQVNIEPLLLQIIKNKDSWPVPTFFGSCGRAIFVEYCGKNLNNFADYNWMDRAYLALQLLQAAQDFTDKHDHYRFYLTDISPDNIAVSDSLQIAFVDLENFILSNKKGNAKNCTHYSEHFENEDELIYSDVNICNSCISDHNIYIICKHLLSDNAPWPMMKGGLLHSPPNFVTKNFNKIFVLINFCVRPTSGINRFEISSDLINVLSKMLS